MKELKFTPAQLRKIDKLVKSQDIDFVHVNSGFVMYKNTDKNEGKKIDINIRANKFTITAFKSKSLIDSSIIYQTTDFDLNVAIQLAEIEYKKYLLENKPKE